MEMQLSGLYIARKVNLGSGPRERALSCCFDYRTSSQNRLNTSYTVLEPDPPMVSYENQSYKRNANSIAPLVKELNRESCKAPNEKMQRRASSAKPRIQTEYLQIAEQPRIGNLMLVKGKTIACQERPNLQRKFSDEQIIKSVQDATTKQLSKLSLHIFGETACASPNAPCPSPEPSEKDFEIMESMFSSEFSTYEENRDYSSGLSDMKITTRKSDQEKGQWEFTVDGSSMDANISEEECLERIEDMAQADIEGHELVEENAVPPIDTQKLFVKFSLPTETDEPDKTPMLSSQCKDTKFPDDSGDTDFQKHDTGYHKHDTDCHKHDTYTDGQINERIAKEKRKCFSASDSFGFIIKSKNVEFLSEEDVFKAKFHVSQNGLEKLLSMDWVVKDGKISRDSSNNNDLGVGEVAVLKNNAFPTKEKKQTDLHSGVQVTSKRPVRTKELGDGSGAQAVVKNPSEDAERGSQTSTENGRHTRANLRSNRRKVEKSSRKRSHRQGRSAEEKEPQLIWRAVSGIDQLKKKSLVATGTQEKLTEKEIESTVSPPSQSPNVEIKENSGSRSISSTEICRRPATAVKSCITIGNFTSKNRESKHQADRTARKIRFTEPSEKRKLTRPTSAVIQRYLEKVSDDQTKSSDKKTTRLARRPMSSNHVSLNRRKQVHLKTRPKSANSPRLFYEGSKSVESRVVAAQPIQLTPTSKQIPLARTQESKHRVQRKGSADIARKAVAHAPPQRPKTAPVKNFTKAGKEVAALDEVREEQEVSEECHKIWKSCQKKGVILSMETLRRALMPPTEFATPYNRHNLPHSSRMLRSAYE